MRHLLVALLFASSSSSAASWESVPLRDDGSVTVWTVAGPLPNTRALSHGESCVGFETDYLVATGGESAAIPAEGDVVIDAPGNRVAWVTAFPDPAGLLDYTGKLDVSKNSSGVSYAFCRLISDKAQRALLKVRSNDGVRVWLNRDRVHDNHVGRAIGTSEDHVPIRLKKGENRLLVKVDQIAGGWGLLLRVTASDGSPIEGVRSAVATDLVADGKIMAAQFSSAEAVLNTPQGPRQAVIAHITSKGLRNVTCEIRKSDWTAPQLFALGALQPFLPRAAVPTVAVFNTLNWKRSGLVEVFIDHEILPRGQGYHITDAQTGEAVLAQPLRSRTEGTYWALWAKDVPPLAYKSLILYESQGGMIRPGKDQLPGSASDWQTVHGFLAVRGRDDQIIWGSDQAPLVQLGGIKLGAWQPIARVEKPHVYSWVMNNYWGTNFRATQQGEFRWSYYLTSTLDTSNRAATHFGWASRVPLVARVLPPGNANQAAVTAACLTRRKAATKKDLQTCAHRAPMLRSKTLNLDA
ncbi:MAG: hypothetical protein ACC645_14825, partial [Pirellulales bacterium]